MTSPSQPARRAQPHGLPQRSGAAPPPHTAFSPNLALLRAVRPHPEGQDPARGSSVRQEGCRVGKAGAQQPLCPRGRSQGGSPRPRLCGSAGNTHSPGARAGGLGWAFGLLTCPWLGADFMKSSIKLFFLMWCPERWEREGPRCWGCTQVMLNSKWKYKYLIQGELGARGLLGAAT